MKAYFWRVLCKYVSIGSEKNQNKKKKKKFENFKKAVKKIIL